MKAGKYNIKDLFSNRYIQQIVIPEIQRDYVWGNDQVTGLLNSIIEDFRKFSNPTDEIDINTEDLELKNSFKEFYRKRKYASNIGFIYAYNDEQYPGKYFLIDGQQRITTIYLLLLILSTKNENLNSRFQSTFAINGELKLDYRVRESAHEFAKDFVAHKLAGKESFVDSNLYFENKYNNDKTIKSILANMEIMSAIVDKLEDVGIEDLYVYIEELVEFWYFDTNVSEQGEELYIYMNARGEQMQGNENIKAELLGRLHTDEEKNHYGKVWEEWQDFFWKKRGKNENADNGFNQFLICIAGLTHFQSQSKTNFYKKEAFDKTGILIKDVLEVLTLELVQKYMDILFYIENNYLEFKEQYKSAEWVDKMIAEYWGIFNSTTTNWYADYSHENRGLERNRMVFLWSIFLYMNAIQSRNPDKDEVFRFFRKTFVRYRNYDRAVQGLEYYVKIIIEKGVYDKSISSETLNNSYESKSGNKNKELTKDEWIKNRIYSRYLDNKNKLREIEFIIWSIEDHPFNESGRDLGNTNFSHILPKGYAGNIEYLDVLRMKFYEVFPVKWKDHNRIKNLLLHYGNFHDEVSPYYYKNLNFGNWRKTIRHKHNATYKENNAFILFFNEFIHFNGSILDFIKIKNKKLIDINNIIDFRTALVYYSQQLGDAMWNEGSYIAISKGHLCSLPYHDSKDPIYSSEYILYNTKGNLKGGTPKALNTLITENNE